MPLLPIPSLTFSLSYLPALSPISGRVISLDAKTGRIELSLRESVVDPSRPLLQLEDFKEGQLVKGTVKRVEKYGVFVDIKRSKVTGLCHISEVGLFVAG